MFIAKNNARKSHIKFFIKTQILDFYKVTEENISFVLCSNCEQ